MYVHSICITHSIYLLVPLNVPAAHFINSPVFEGESPPVLWQQPSPVWLSAAWPSSLYELWAKNAGHALHICDAAARQLFQLQACCRRRRCPCRVSSRRGAQARVAGETLPTIPALPVVLHQLCKAVQSSDTGRVEVRRRVLGGGKGGMGGGQKGGGGWGGAAMH